MNDKTTEEKTPAQVPFYVFESVQCRFEREANRYRAIIGVLAAATVLTNAAWLLRFFRRDLIMSVYKRF